MQLVAYPDVGKVFVEPRSETGRNLYAGFFILE